MNILECRWEGVIGRDVRLEFDCVFHMESVSGVGVFLRSSGRKAYCHAAFV